MALLPHVGIRRRLHDPSGRHTTPTRRTRCHSEQNKAIVRRHFEELWTKGNLVVADEIYSPQAVGHYSSNPDLTGYPEVEKDLVQHDKVAFPDGVVTVEAQIAEGDQVVTRWRFDATHTGPLYENPASRPSDLGGRPRHSTASWTAISSRSGPTPTR